MHHDIQLFAEYAVTPFVGVWIETATLLKTREVDSVTPFVGVWIETATALQKYKEVQVTPFVGVWIETRPSSRECKAYRSHTLRGCVD